MISIITPFYNNKEKLYKLLRSIKEADREGLEIEVIAVDDYSEIDILPDIKKDFDFVRPIRLSEKRGPAFARNKGADMASGDILLFLDSDVILKKDTLLKVKKAFERDDVTALEGEYDAVPVNPGFFPRYKALEYRSFVGDQEYLTILGPRICAIRRNIFSELGGFNASYATASVEDYEFSYRLHDKGYKIHYDKTLEVGHHFPENTIRQFRLSFHRAKLWSRLFAKRKKFDNFGTTLPEGLGRLAGFAFLVSLPFLFVSVYLVICSLLLFLLYILLNRKFFTLILKEEGPIFLLRAIPTHLLISVFITLGFAWGILTSKRGMA